MDCDGWWLRTALHRLACLPPVRPGHTPLAALAPLSLGERGKGGAKPPGCPSKPLPTIALLGVGRIGGLFRRGRFETCPCVGLCAGPVGWRRWVRTGHPLRSLRSASPYAEAKGTVRLVGLPVVGEGGWEGVDDGGGVSVSPGWLDGLGWVNDNWSHGCELRQCGLQGGRCRAFAAAWGVAA